MPRDSKLKQAVLALMLAVAVPLGSVQAQDEGLLEYEQNTVDIVRTYGPSVVAVDVVIAGRTVSGGGQFSPMPDFFREFLPPQFQFPFQQPQEMQIPSRETAGSGFVVDADGHIMTNYHVIAGALEEGTVTVSEGSSVTVAFPGGESLPVEVIGVSSIYDLALLRLADPSDLPESAVPIELGDTDSLRPGQKAIAIGNPFGFESTVTMGIVSAVGRHFPYIGEVEFPLVQTDAPINPGNSGGPLLDSSGRLIGVNTAIIPTVSATGDRGNLGIGFAVPADIVASTLPDLRAGGVHSIPTRPRLGISIRDIDSFPAEVREQLGLPDEGVGVMEVEAGGAAEEAGLRNPSFSITLPGIQQPVPVPADVITAVNGEPVGSASQLQSRIVRLGEGDTVTLTVWRAGEELEIDVTLKVVPDSSEEAD